MQVALLVGIIAVAGASPPASPDADPAARALALAGRIEAHHAQVKDFEGRFEQRYRSSLLGREVVERGTIAIKRPDRMLWKYEEPEAKTFVSDGSKTYFYVPADHQVIVREAKGEQGVALHLLSGQASLSREFEVSPVAGRDDRVRLVPRDTDPEVSAVTIEADAQGAIRSLEVVDLQGNRSLFVFSNVKENVGLADRLFEFKIPRGVAVVAG